MNTIKIKKLPNFPAGFELNYATEFSSGIDLIWIDDILAIQVDERLTIKTGIVIELPKGFEAQIRPRSGLARDKGITVLNTPATIDNDFRGEIEIVLINLGSRSVVFEKGDRIAQMVIVPVERMVIVYSDTLSETKRGKNGFGSTGR